MENKKDFDNEVSELRQSFKRQKHSDDYNLSLLLYGAVAMIMLSKELFPRNSDISVFLEKNEIYFKKYVYASRTQIIARLIRVIQKATFEENTKMFNSIEKLVSQYEPADKQKQKYEKDNKRNTVDQLLTQFGRHE
ncbi:hypothetical protein [Pediococcus pentosaceus]|uniref:hypothetical protein n=1 Tax=Pediococcus pentosaceus TaxID=1255 RepID=UPI0039824D4D